LTGFHARWRIPPIFLVACECNEYRAAAFHIATETETSIMLKWILILLIVAAIASLLGFHGVAGVAGTLARVLIFIVLVVLALALLFGLIAVA
jgi:uncharacterized membrane protein YtjA (UPF0391 family)